MQKHKNAEQAIIFLSNLEMMEWVFLVLQYLCSDLLGNVFEDFFLKKTTYK